MRSRFSSSFMNIPLVVKNLLIINVLLFIFKSILETRGFDLTSYLGLFYFKSELFRPHQFVTHMFMHANIQHIFFNMFALWMFGRVLEGVWGSKRFLIYFFITGLGAAFLHTFVNWLSVSKLMAAAQVVIDNPNPDNFYLFITGHFKGYYNPQELINFVNNWNNAPNNTAFLTHAVKNINEFITGRLDIPTVGASGAVFGILLAFGMLFPNTQLMLLFPPIPIKAKYFVIGYGVIELILAFSQPGDNVAHFAHLGGMIFGFIAIKYWNKHGSSFY